MVVAGARPLGQLRRNGAALWAVAAAATVLAIGGGLIGTYRYLDNYWLYRGFAPPKDPAFVTSKGRLVHFDVRSAALGGKRQPVYVYLPPGYDSHPSERYPVVYLLHGFPGVPITYFRAGRLGVVEDILVAKHQIGPVILAAPFGSTGAFTDKEWANGVRPHEAWETFVAHDVVSAVDRRFRTIRAGRARALIGLSEGGYGALNIGLHHPGEFRVLESWSGYEQADDIASIFGKSKALLLRNSPSATLAAAARRLRAAHAYVWFYSGSSDKKLLAQNAAFERGLARLGIPSHYMVFRGGHDWALWRGEAANALYAACRHLGSGARHVPGTGVA